MATVYETITNHRSIRKYLDKAVEEDIIDKIIDVVSAAPSSKNGQQVSVILIRDVERKKQVAKLSGNQPFIEKAPLFFIFCMDFNRAQIAVEKNNSSLGIAHASQTLIRGSVEVGICVANAINYVESIGLGAVAVGGIRHNPDEIIKLLELPNLVYPLIGLSVGYSADKSAKKPRLPKEAIFFEERYSSEGLRDYIDEYDETMRQYMLERTEGKASRNWSETIASAYKANKFVKITETLTNQGFLNE